MARDNLSDVRRRAWRTRRERWGPRGHAPIQPWRRKPSAREKRMAAQEVGANVKRETVIAQ